MNNLLHFSTFILEVMNTLFFYPIKQHFEKHKKELKLYLYCSKV